MNINDFKSNFQGGARPSLFRVDQNFPAGIGGEAQRAMSYLCKGAQLPGDTVGNIDVYYMGRQIKVAGDRTFEDMTLTIINDIDFTVRNAFEQWMTLLNTHEGNLGVVNPNGYWADLTITQLGRDGSDLKTYKLISAYPNSISPIDVAFDSTDQVEEFSVTMSYQYWQTDTIK
jgi:T4-like virus tail tube protein gp19